MRSEIRHPKESKVCCKENSSVDKTKKCDTLYDEDASRGRCKFEINFDASDVSTYYWVCAGLCGNNQP